jgi:co-chaperonin GroES (HSP10)
MKITPLKNKIYFKVEKPTIAGLDLSSKPTTTEVGEVIAIGAGIDDVKVGDTIFVKAWCQDIFQYKDEWYYFADYDSKGIVAIVEDDNSL